MSRAYRIKVRESLRTTIHAEDHVSTQLELLEILPKEQMAELLGAELEKRGFRREGEVVVREENEVTVRVNLETGEVSVQAQGAKDLDLATQKDGFVYDEWGSGDRRRAQESLRDQAKKDLEKDAQHQTEKLQKEITDQLEGQLADIKKELDKAVNRSTAEALKKKAASLGEIKHLADDPETDSLTIVVEV